MKRASDAPEDSAKRQKSCGNAESCEEAAKDAAPVVSTLPAQQHLTPEGVPNDMHGRAPPAPTADTPADALGTDPADPTIESQREASNKRGLRAVPQPERERLPSPQHAPAVLPLRDPRAAMAAESSVLQQRKDAVQQLYSMYHDMFWALGEELDLRRQLLLESGQPLWEGPEVPAASLEGGETGTPLEAAQCGVRQRYRRLAEARQLAHSQSRSSKVSGDGKPRSMASASATAAVSTAAAAAAATAAAGSARTAGAVPQDGRTGRQDASPRPVEPTAAAVASVRPASAPPSAEATQGTVIPCCDEECPSFSDVEEAVIQGGQKALQGGDQAPQDGDQPSAAEAALLEGYRNFRGRLQQLGRLECSASTGAAAEMESAGVLATLQGGTTRIGLRTSSVFLGRKTPGTLDVDVDLASTSLGGPAASVRVSRQAAQLSLGSDGVWRLRVMGRAPLRVNDVTVSSRQEIEVPHLSIIQADQVRLLFMSNPHAVRRAMKATRHQARAAIEV